jgi:hypothetical protein
MKQYHYAIAIVCAALAIGAPLAIGAQTTVIVHWWFGLPAVWQIAIKLFFLSGTAILLAVTALRRKKKRGA